MKSSTTVAFLIVLSCNLLTAQVPEFEWVTGPGGTGNVTRSNVDADISGNVIISANFNGSISFGSTTLIDNSVSGKICLVKYNSSGEVLWARKEGGDNFENVEGTAVDQNGNIFLTGYFTTSTTLGDITLGPNGGFYLAKFDPSGNILWAKQSSGGNVGGKHVKTDALGNAYVTGGFQGTPTFGDITLTDDGGVYIAKYDPSGNALWVEQCHGSGSGQAYGLDVDDTGNSIITGVFENQVDWGSTSMTDTTGSDMFIAKYNSSGDLQWAKQIGIINDAWGMGAAFDNSGNCYFIGDFIVSANFDGTIINAVGSWDSSVAKYSSDGTFQWVRSVKGSGGDHGWDIDVDPQNNVVYTGCFENTAIFGSTTLTSKSADQYDIFISKYDESGNHLWAKRAGSTEEDQGRGMIINNQGRVFNTGWIMNGGTADFDSHELSTSGIFLSLLEANYIIVTPESHEVGYTAGSKSTAFSVDANVQWSVSDTSSWLNSSKNGDNIDVDYDANPFPVERTATITVSGDGCSENVTVVQDPAPCQLTVTPKDLKVSYSEGVVKVVVDSNSKWNFNKSAPWLIAKNTHTDTLTIEYDANESVERSATITVFNTCLTSTDVNITQDGKPVFIDNLFENGQLYVYPNPTHDKIYLKSEHNIDTELTVSLYDNIGRMVFSQHYKNLNILDPLEIDIAELESGIYLLQISTLNDSGSTVVMKE